MITKLCILLVKANYKASPDLRDRKNDSNFWWEILQNYIAKGHEDEREIIVANSANNLAHPDIWPRLYTSLQ